MWLNQKRHEWSNQRQNITSFNPSLPTLISSQPLANFWLTLNRKIIKQVTKEAFGITTLPPHLKSPRWDQRESPNKATWNNRCASGPLPPRSGCNICRALLFYHAQATFPSIYSGLRLCNHKTRLYWTIRKYYIFPGEHYLSQGVHLKKHCCYLSKMHDDNKALCIWAERFHLRCVYSWMDRTTL